MKLNIIVALSLVSGMAFAVPEVKTEGGKVKDKTTEAGKEEIKKQEESAKMVVEQKTGAKTRISKDSKIQQGIDYLRQVAESASGREDHMAAGGIADAAASGDARSKEVALFLYESIAKKLKANANDETAVSVSFDETIAKFGLNKEEVVKNCKGK